MTAKIVSIVGARPQFIKSAPLCRELAKRAGLGHAILHTGQHYDHRMSSVFFDELGIPEPAWNLEVGSGPHGAQTGEMLRKIEDVLMREGPRAVIVYGDTNSTLAGAVAASKLGVPVVHLEAGLRSFRKAMPEEINRVAADHLSTVLLCPTENAAANLVREGFPQPANGGRLWDPPDGAGDAAFPAPTMDRPLVVNVGDIMLDSMKHGPAGPGEPAGVLARLGVRPGEYVLATVHRPDNTDAPERLAAVVDALSGCGRPVVFPAHPRCVKEMARHGIVPGGGVIVIDPVGHADMLALERNARVVATDSGGVQKEAYFLGVPCVTLREETEWIETLAEGRNRLAGNGGAIRAALREAEAVGRFDPGGAFGRGDTARRVAALTELLFGETGGRPGEGGRGAGPRRRNG